MRAMRGCCLIFLAPFELWTRSRPVGVATLDKLLAHFRRSGFEADVSGLSSLQLAFVNNSHAKTNRSIWSNRSERLL